MNCKAFNSSSKMNKKLIFAPLLLLIFAGCQNEKNIQSQALVNTQTTQATTLEIPFDTAQLKGNDIYCFDQKVGAVKGDRVFMKLDDKIISFIPPTFFGREGSAFNINEMKCNISQWEPADVSPYGGVKKTPQYANFSYQGLDVSTKIYSPNDGIYNSIISPAENKEITYRCDGSLVKMANKDGKYTVNEPYFNCDTNGKDYLTQFELNGATVYPDLALDNRYSKEWKKIFIKKVDNVNYVLMATLHDSDNDVWLSDADNAQEKLISLSQERYLINLKKDPWNSQGQAQWQQMVDSLKVEPGKVL